MNYAYFFLKNLIFGIFIFLLFFSPFSAMAIEEPSYNLILSQEPFELRDYDEFIVAETYLNGSFDTASRKGFRRVASYIFGGNIGLDGKSEKIQMTAPVTVTPVDEEWILHFVMPKNYNISDLPIPNDSNVKIRKVERHYAAVIVFSGWTTDSKIRKKTDQLKDWIAYKNYKINGPVQVARYNDPFTIPWLRRNEIILKVTEIK